MFKKRQIGSARKTHLLHHKFFLFDYSGEWQYFPKRSALLGSVLKINTCDFNLFLATLGSHNSIGKVEEDLYLTSDIAIEFIHDKPLLSRLSK